MSTEEVKPVIPTEIPPVAEELKTETEPVKAIDPAPTTGLTTAAPAEESVKTTEAPAETPAKEEKKEEKPVEPIYSGALGYKAPGLVNQFRFAKKYFWFGEEPVSTDNLSAYLRGEKPDVAHPTAAWSSQTGKGLLYFVKHADQKTNPAGVLNLAEATDVTKDGATNFLLKLHGHKHTFEASTVAERNGWFLALEKAVEEAKAAKEGIVSSEGYKEHLEKLGKPAGVAAGPTAAKETAPKKSVDGLKPTDNAETPARAGSSSSEDGDAKKKAKTKSRSVSRGKRASVFGSVFGKKEPKETKAEEKKEEQAEEKKVDPIDAAAAVATAEASLAVPATTEEAKPVTEEVKPTEPVAPVVPEAAAENAGAPVTETPTEEKIEKPRPAKRGSIFGSFYEKLRSPTQEKKESEILPKKEETTEAPASEAPKIEDPIVPVAEPAVTTEAPATEEAVKPTETKPTETKPTTTPHKEKSGFSFGKFLNKAKSPTSETAPKVEEPAKTEEAPKIEETHAAPAAEVSEAPKLEEATPATTTTATATPAARKRGSVFGNLTGGSVKKEKDGAEGEQKKGGLGGLFRNASKAGKSKKEKEATTTPPKVEETNEPAEAKKEEPTAVTAPVTTEAKPAEPTSIGDVVPSAVEVGHGTKSTPEVSATA